MQVNLDEQVALVTGGAQGIGRAIVETLAKNGARVVIVDIEAEMGVQTAQEVEEAGDDGPLAPTLADLRAGVEVAD